MKPYKYAFGNNKGGVGKTFLCFAVASEYALKRKDIKIVIIDMCSQANVSEILLGVNGSGDEKLQGLLKKRDKAQTIGGYYYQWISASRKNGSRDKLSAPSQKVQQECIGKFAFNRRRSVSGVAGEDDQQH